MRKVLNGWIKKDFIIFELDVWIADSATLKKFTTVPGDSRCVNRCRIFIK